MQRPLSVLAAVSFTLFAFLGLAETRPARAQTPPPEAPPAPRPAAPQPIRNLLQALEAVPWDAGARGPLLVVAPDATQPWKPKPPPGAPPETRWQPGPPLAPAPRGGYRLNTVAPYFGRKIVRLDTLTVLAPTEMVVFNLRPGKPDPLAGMRRDQKMQYFAASLSPAQWRLLGSAQGLGMGDLTPEQRPLFLGMLPPRLRIQRVTASPGGGQQMQTVRDLTPAERANVRLRVFRSARYLIPFANRANSYMMLDPRYESPGATEGAESFAVSDTGEYEARPEAFGVTLRQEVPNRLKPGQLDFDAAALRASVSLAGGTGIAAPSPFARPVAPTAPAAPPSLTVGDLVKRVAEATRIELYADPRVGNLPVWTRGERARSGDVLKALCYAVTGTFRKVGPAFVLTDDIAGIGTRRALLSEWAQDAQALQSKDREALDKRLREMKLAQFVGFREDDPSAPSPEMLQKIEELQRRPYKPGEDRDLPVRELPAALQAMLRQYSERRIQLDTGEEALRTDRAQIYLTTRLGYVVPGIGTVEDRSMDLGSLNGSLTPPPVQPPEPPPAPAVVFPPTMKTRALLVAPATADEAARAAREAKRRGLTQLWLSVPEGAAGKELLASALAAGRKEQLPVLAVVRLLRSETAGATFPAETLDINILGENGSAAAARRARSAAAQINAWMRERYLSDGDWLRPDAALTATLVKKRLLDLAATPSLAGIVLQDTAAPGYADPSTTSSRSFSGSDRLDFGYTPEMRLAFLRKQGADPVDLASPFQPAGGADLNLPFFSDAAFQAPFVQVEGRWTQDPNFRSLLQLWRAFRYGEDARLMADLHAALRDAHPDLPLWVRDRSDEYGEGNWYGTWDRADALPRAMRDFEQPNPPGLAQIAHNTSRRAFFQTRFQIPPAPDPKFDAAKSFVGMLGYVLEQQKRGWDGIVFDLSAVPLDQALPLLDALNGAATPPRQPPRVDTGAAR